MLQLIFCSVLNGRGQGKTRSHFRRGLLFCSSPGTWMSGDGDPTAGRRGKLTTGNISWRIMRQLIFCLRARKWCLAYSIRESKPFVRRDSSANDVCSIAEIIPFPASMIGETCSHESGTGTGRPQMCLGWRCCCTEPNSSSFMRFIAVDDIRNARRYALIFSSGTRTRTRSSLMTYLSASIRVA